MLAVIQHLYSCMWTLSQLQYYTFQLTMGTLRPGKIIGFNSECPKLLESLLLGHSVSVNAKRKHCIIPLAFSRAGSDSFSA